MERLYLLFVSLRCIKKEYKMTCNSSTHTFIQGTLPKLHFTILMQIFNRKQSQITISVHMWYTLLVDLTRIATGSEHTPLSHEATSNTEAVQSIGPDLVSVLPDSVVG